MMKLRPDVIIDVSTERRKRLLTEEHDNSPIFFGTETTAKENTSLNKPTELSHIQSMEQSCDMIDSHSNYLLNANIAEHT